MEMQTPSKETSRMIDCLRFGLCSYWVVAKILEVVADSFVSAESATWVSTVVFDHRRRADRQTDRHLYSISCC
jgi:hypothetical protein